jgi:Lipocalin-like domain
MRFLALIIALLCLPSPLRANDVLIGNWKLVSFYTVDSQTRQRTNTYGEHPIGAIGFTPGRRFFAFVTADNREPPQTAEDQVAAFKAMVAYTGKYRVEGDSFITNVDVAPNPALVGAEQVRFWKIVDGKLHITTAPLPNPNSPGGTLIGTLVWERE